jgi:hypothetical protein
VSRRPRRAELGPRGESLFEHRAAIETGRRRCRIRDSAAETTEPAQESAALAAAAAGDALENSECFADAASAATRATEKTCRIQSAAATTAATFTAEAAQIEARGCNALENGLARRIGQARRDVGAALLSDARSALNQAGSSVDDGRRRIDDDDVGHVRVDDAAVDDSGIRDGDEVVVERAAAAASSEDGREKKGDENEEEGALHGAKTYYGSLSNGRRSPHSFEPR